MSTNKSNGTGATAIRFRAGLVGAGHISEFHVQALQRIPFVEIVGVHDLDRAKAEALAERFKLPVAGSLAELRAAGANVIHVATPPHTHAAVATEALRAGCHVFVEKPLATDADDCVKLRDLGARPGPRDRRLPLAALRSASPQRARGGPQRQARRPGRGRHPAQLGVSALRGRAAAAAVPHRGVSVPRPRHPRALRDRGVPGTDSRGSTPSGGRGPATRTWRSTTGGRWSPASAGSGQVQLSWGVRPLQHQIILQGTKGVMRLDLFLMFQASRRPAPLPKAAERIVNALTDSIQPLIDVPRNVVAFARKQIRQYHGVQELIIAFYDALADGPPAARHRRRRDLAPFAGRRRSRAPPIAITKSAPASCPSTPQVPYLVTGASGGSARRCSSGCARRRTTVRSGSWCAASPSGRSRGSNTCAATSAIPRPSIAPCAARPACSTWAPR